MKTLTSALALACCIAGPAGAATRDAPLTIIDAPVFTARLPSVTSPLRMADFVPLPANRVVTPPVRMSELPEPEVFLMMLVGLCLIGYRASRVSDEKFE